MNIRIDLLDKTAPRFAARSEITNQIRIAYSLPPERAGGKAFHFKEGVNAGDERISIHKPSL